MNHSKVQDSSWIRLVSCMMALASLSSNGKMLLLLTVMFYFSVFNPFFVVGLVSHCLCHSSECSPRPRLHFNPYPKILYYFIYVNEL